MATGNRRVAQSLILEPKGKGKKTCKYYKVILEWRARWHNHRTPPGVCRRARDHIFDSFSLLPLHASNKIRTSCKLNTSAIVEISHGRCLQQNVCWESWTSSATFTHDLKIMIQPTLVRIFALDSNTMQTEHKCDEWDFARKMFATEYCETWVR